MILKLLILLLCFCYCICVRHFPTSKMCRGESDRDCSFQIPDAHENACSIYFTPECIHFNFSTWNLKPLVVPSSESDAPFNVSLFPFAASPHYLFSPNPISAVNLTLTVLDTGISGFSVHLWKDQKNIYNTTCAEDKLIWRFFDFKNSLHSLNKPVTFFYDCYYKLVEEEIENATMIITSYPVNVELSYLVYIPDVIYLKSVCKWQPLVMIYQGSLQKNHIQMKFSPPLEDIDVQFYVITLLDLTNNKVKSKEIRSNKTKEMLSTEFFSVKRGYYFISINIFARKKEEENFTFCEVSKTSAFYVGIPPEGNPILILLVVLGTILTITLAAVFIYYFCYGDAVRVQSSCKLKLLIVYSPDCEELNKLVLSFIDYLVSNYHVTVCSTHGLDCKPIAWLAQEYASANVIIFVVSEGIYHMLQEDNIPPMKVKHQWKEQVPVTMSYIEQMMYSKRSSTDKPGKKKRFCLVCFPFSGKHHIPECLKCISSFFMLPHDESKFYRYLFGYTSVFRWLRHYRILRHSLNMKNDTSMNNNFNRMMETVSANLHIQYIENSDGDSSTDEDRHINECNSGEGNKFKAADENVNCFVKDESVYSSNKLLMKDLSALNKGNNLHFPVKSYISQLSSEDNNTYINFSGAENCKEQNSQFSRLDSDSSGLEEKDYMEHFVGKHFAKI